MDSIIESVKKIAEKTSDAVRDTVDLTNSAVVGTAKLTGAALSGTAKLTEAALTGTAKFTGSALAETAKFTGSAISETAKFTGSAISGTARLTSDILGSSLQLLNVKDMLVGMARQYVVDYLLSDNPTQTRNQIIESNLIYMGSQLLFHPFERIRILIQNQALMKDHKSYTGAFDALFKEIRYMGLRYLWRGYVPITAYNLFYYNLLDFRAQTIINSYNSDKDFNHVYEILKKLYLYDFLLMLGSHPIESLGVRMASDRDKTYSFDIMRKNILKNPFNGIVSNFIQLNLNYIILSPLVFYLEQISSDKLEWFAYLIGGMLFVDFVTYPFELIKTRLMINDPSYESKYHTIRNAIRVIYREEHISGFYRGAYLKFVNFWLRKIVLYLVADQYRSFYPNNVKIVN